MNLVIGVGLVPARPHPSKLVEAISDRVSELEDIDLITGMALHPYKFFQSPAFIGRINFHTVFYGAYARNFFKVGNVNVNSIHLSEMFVAARDVYHVNTLLADVSFPDEEGYLYFGPMGAVINGELAEIATKKTVQVSRFQPKVPGSSTAFTSARWTISARTTTSCPNCPNPKSER